MRPSSLVRTILALLLASAPAAAGTIDFEDLPASNDPQQTLSDEYAYMGVHFSSWDEGATWSGMAGGDPGGWQLDGTNGAQFLGFDGSSYTTVITFDEPVSEFSFDVSRGNGSYWLFNSVTATGFRGGSVVEAKAVYLGAVNDWKTIAMTEDVDRVHLRGIGFPGYRFGIDDLEWAGETLAVMPVDIDVLPDSDDNPIQLKSRGVVPVVLFGAEDFDVLDVDVDTLAFGPAGAGIAHRNGPHFEDVDGDGYLDMVLHHRVQDCEFLPEDEEACLTGETTFGEMFEGCDMVMPLE